VDDKKNRLETQILNVRPMWKKSMEDINIKKRLSKYPHMLFNMWKTSVDMWIT